MISVQTKWMWENSYRSYLPFFIHEAFCDTVMHDIDLKVFLYNSSLKPSHLHAGLHAQMPCTNSDTCDCAQFNSHAIIGSLIPLYGKHTRNALLGDDILLSHPYTAIPTVVNIKI